MKLVNMFVPVTQVRAFPLHQKPKNTKRFLKGIIHIN